MTAPGKMPERIKAVIEPDWHEGATGRRILGGEWRATWRSGAEYIRADLCAPDPLLAEALEALRAMTARFELYGGEDGKFFGHHDRALYEQGRAVLAKMENRNDPH